MRSVPLVVDLDGTLVNTDMLHELAVKLFTEKPLSILGFPFALRKGKAFLKQHICARTGFDASLLPYNQGLMEWLRKEHSQGREIVLCTASDLAIAHPIAEHVGLFSEVMASDGRLNLSGNNKADALVAKYGEQGFDYCGNASIDLLVWERARHAVVVNASANLINEASQIATVTQQFSSPLESKRVFYEMLATYHWFRNLKLFAVAALLSLFSQHVVLLCLLFAGSFLLGSATPIGWDLLHIWTHRQPKSRTHNSFASGKTPIVHGVIAVLAASLGLLLVMLLLISALN